MPIHVNLTENDWKANGLPKRTTMEKLKNKKTQISEALRAYAAVANGGIDALPAKTAKLKAVKTVLTAARGTHKGNTALLAHIAKMEAGLVAEAAALNAGLNALTLKTILSTPALYQFFLKYCTDVEHNPEPTEFLHVANSMAKPALINTFIKMGSPKEVNIPATMRDPLIAAPNDAGKLKTVYEEVEGVVEVNELKRFKVKYKVTL